MVAPCKLIIRVLFVILLLFMGQGSAAPIALEGREVSSQLTHPDPQTSSMDSTSFHWHGPKDHSGPEAAVGVVQAPELHEEKPDNEGDTFAGQAHAGTHSFLNAHLALVIILFTLAPFALCAALYPIIRCYRNRRKNSQAANDDPSTEDSDQSFDEKDSCPETPRSGDSNQTHLEPLTDGPRLVYVPPTPENGIQPLFGHFLSPCGQVLGVKDTWMLADSGEGISPCTEHILVHEAY